MAYFVEIAYCILGLVSYLADLDLPKPPGRPEWHIHIGFIVAFMVVAVTVIVLQSHTDRSPNHIELQYLNRYFPEGIDIYFENVGGPMLDAVLLNMRIHGRIAVCGMVSQHSYRDEEGIHNLVALVTKRIRMQGFLQSDYLHLFPQFVEQVRTYYKQGKIVYIEDVSEGLESAPAALAGLFTGENIGKQVVRVSQD